MTTPVGGLQRDAGALRARVLRGSHNPKVAGSNPAAYSIPGDRGNSTHSAAANQLLIVGTRSRRLARRAEAVRVPFQAKRTTASDEKQ